MIDDSEPGFDRYKATLRRLWPILAVGVLAGGLIGAASASSQFEATAQILIVNNGTPVSTGQLSPDSLLTAVPVTAVIARANLDDIETKVADQIGSGVELALAAGDSNSISVTVSTVSAAATDKALDSVVAQIRTERGQLVQEALAPVLAALKQQQDTTDGRLADLDAQVAKLGGDQQSLATAYAVARVSLGDLSNQLALQSVAWKEYLAAAPNAVRLGDHVAPTASSKVLSGLVGAFGGMLLVGLGIVLFTSIDRSVRSSVDLRRIGAPLVGLLSSSGDDWSVGALAGALAHTVSKEDDRTVGLVPAGRHTLDPVAGVSLTERVASYDGTRLDVHPPFLVDPDTSIRAQNGAYVVVGKWGRTRSDDMSSAVGVLRAAGCNVAGVALFDVPPRRSHGWFE